jgi:endo-1,4-beta-xylanase
MSPSTIVGGLTPTPAPPPSRGRELSRRGVLTLAAAGAVVGAAPALAQAPSLNDLARAKGMRFGGAVGAWRSGHENGSYADPRYWSLLAAQCGLIVPENELKWYTVHPAPGVYAFARADAMQTKAEAAGLAMRGHNLLWNRPEYLTAWVNAYDFGSRPASAAEKLLVEHIETVCAHYPHIRSWDVVNETIDEDTGAMRETVFTRYLGPEAIDIAFHAARRAAPQAQLVYNDYMSWEAGSARHREGVLRLLERLKAAKVPVDALGLQSHIKPTGPEVGQLAKAQTAEWRRCLDGATGMGYGLLVTEFDVADKYLPGDIAVRDRAVADYARAYLDLTLSYPQVKDVLGWGLVDSYSWLQAETPRSDGLPERPTPYDAEFRAKPLREAVAAAFAGAPVR